MQGLVRDGVRTVGDEANGRLAPEELPELWLTDDEDEQEISAPVARIIYRHMPTGGNELGNPDLGDAIAALLALFVYVRKQLSLIRDWRRLHREQPTNDKDEAA